jgi:hypothetical protein
MERNASKPLRDLRHDLVALDLTQGYEPTGLSALRAPRAEHASELPVIVL